MSEAGWVELRTVTPGVVFETNAGDKWVRTSEAYGRIGCQRIYTHSTAEGGKKYGIVGGLMSADALVRPLTPVPVAPSLPADLKGLLLGALATGVTDPLCDFLLERLADPDVRRAVRENARRELAKEVVYRDDARPGHVGVRLSDDLIKLAGLWPVAEGPPVSEDDLDALWNRFLNLRPVAPEPPRFPTFVAGCPIANHAPDCDCQGAGGDR